MIISDMHSRKPHILWRDYQSRLNPPFYKLIRLNLDPYRITRSG
ncbi:hypothetical protein F383_25180 [Gossypium arboreum]|uniref:Uncharacterized protein n=1 Tax=Gossypium arboreum TaxID=29729 RepID=A0A0B0P306_GOSAR|nr:hypothetical protein F383_25180 [Gossypium arboreum]